MESNQMASGKGIEDLEARDGKGRGSYLDEQLHGVGVTDQGDAGGLLVLSRC